MKKTYFVTGASRGLGLELTNQILANGDNLVATARHPERLDYLKTKYPNQLVTVLMDVTDIKAVQRAVQIAFDSFGTVDVVINNAGYIDFAFLEDEDMDVFKRQINTNFYGPVYVTKTFLPYFRKQTDENWIINISSAMSKSKGPGSAAYTAAKAAEIAFSEAINAEMQPFNVHVWTIEPGGMRTEFTQSASLKTVSAPYKTVYGDMLKSLNPHASDKFPGDAAKSAAAILVLPKLKDYDQSLPFGIDSLAISNAYAKATLDSNQKHQEWITSNVADDFDPRQYNIS